MYIISYFIIMFIYIIHIFELQLLIILIDLFLWMKSSTGYMPRKCVLDVDQIN